MQPQNNKRDHRGPTHRGHKGSPTSEGHSKPSGSWKKKYKCHTNKGDHSMKLVKSDWSGRKKDPALTVEEYYLEEEKLRDICLKKQKKDREGGIIRGWCAVIYHYECTACGRKDLGMNKRKYGL